MAKEFAKVSMVGGGGGAHYSNFSHPFCIYALKAGVFIIDPIPSN